ncbi:hypothetical protein QAD02_014602 [Eretmocerus hayati]|uniref:Uncharacterized protein n=1 Tax=Eretmocerus hayati TaxID=131215 RepID=A0ACC2P5Z8_9HYME|nr:hypothetical protein QAD02_014602 [Eretmocerus hayati]
MSHRINNLALTNADVVLKAFVREQEDVPPQNKKNWPHKLKFDGDEAKKCYEEIISNKSQPISSPPSFFATKDTIHKQSKSQSASLRNEDGTTRNTKSKGPKSINTLLQAIEMGNLKFVQDNCDPNNVDNCDQFGWTPLMCAAYAGNFDIVDFLIKLGAKTKTKDKAGLTALELATKKNHLQIMNLLKDKFYKKKKESSVQCKKPTQLPRDSESSSCEGFHCDMCKMFFKESSKERHESSTLHIFNSSPNLRNIFYGIPKQNRGYQMLLSNGWNEEVGLGPTGEGQKYPVKTVLKRDRKGLGQAKNDIPRVTHFEPRDKNAVRSVYQHQRPPNKRDRERQHRRELAKEKAYRRALS